MRDRRENLRQAIRNEQRMARGITRPGTAIKVIYGSAFGHVGRSPKTTPGVTRQVYVSIVHHPVDKAHCLPSMILRERKLAFSYPGPISNPISSQPFYIPNS
ncbi:hypothetical protein M0802_004131 [Mischocyttarus mexicanus]|nr:hypothetical protein M0802_004131 [Mischocyttarus mexicanus]